MSLNLHSLSATLGAEVTNIDLSQSLPDATIESLNQAWADHLVLVFRDQSLTDKGQVRASSYFGICEKAPLPEAVIKGDGHVEMLPEVTVISNVLKEGEPIGSLSNLELIWHTDMSYNEVPPNGSALFAIELPAGGGGETGFLNMYRAYETLPDALKHKLAGKFAIHDFTYTSAGTLRKGFQEVEDVRNAPGARHPMLRTHPITGKTALFLGRRTNAYILGLTVEESEELLDAVWSHTENEEFVYTHSWRPGDLVLWDNRCVMHRREAFEATDRRIMHRTQLEGEVPYFSG